MILQSRARDARHNVQDNLNVPVAVHPQSRRHPPTYDEADSLGAKSAEHPNRPLHSKGV